MEGSKHCKHLYTEDDRGGNWGGGEEGGGGQTSVKRALCGATRQGSVEL